MHQPRDRPSDPITCQCCEQQQPGATMNLIRSIAFSAVVAVHAATVNLQVCMACCREVKAVVRN